MFARIEDLFPFLKQRLKQKAGTLSGGEQKMLLVARALIRRPRLILIDEITEGMQPSVIERLAGILRRERDESGVATLLVEQHVSFAFSVAIGACSIGSGVAFAAPLPAPPPPPPPWQSPTIEGVPANAPPPPPSGARRADASGDGSSWPKWALPAMGAAACASLAVVAVHRRVAQPHPADHELDATDRDD